jgi:hypothetical protein
VPLSANRQVDYRGPPLCRVGRLLAHAIALSMTAPRRARFAAAARWGCTVACVVTLVLWMAGPFYAISVSHQSFFTGSAGRRHRVVCGCGTIGYLLSRIQPGTLTHIEGGLDWSRGGIAPLIWYGILAGLHPDSNVKRHLGGIGYRILRDLLQPGMVWNRPRADVSYQEAALLRAKDQLADITTAVPGVIAMELLPLVVAHVRKRDSEPVAATPDASSQDVLKETHELVRRIDALLSRAVPKRNETLWSKGRRSR